MTIIAEPGRYYVSSAYTLATTIHSKREVFREGALQSIMYFINDGVYGSFNCNLYDHKVVYPVPIKVWTVQYRNLDNLTVNMHFSNTAIQRWIIQEFRMGTHL